jgi:hypothetical protein
MTILLASLLLAQATAPPAVYPPGQKPYYRGHSGTACADWRTARGRTKS